MRWPGAAGMTAWWRRSAARHRGHRLRGWLDRIVLAMEARGVPASPLRPHCRGRDPTRRRGRAAVVAAALREAACACGRTDQERLGRQLEAAAKLGARWAVIVGEELTRGAVILRDLADGSQQEVSLERVPAAVRTGDD